MSHVLTSSVLESSINILEYSPHTAMSVSFKLLRGIAYSHVDVYRETCDIIIQKKAATLKHEWKSNLYMYIVE